MIVKHCHHMEACLRYVMVVVSKTHTLQEQAREAMAPTLAARAMVMCVSVWT